VKPVEVESAAAAAAALAVAEANKSRSQRAQPPSADAGAMQQPPRPLYHMQHASTRPPPLPVAATVKTAPQSQPQPAQRPSAADGAAMECMIERQLLEMDLGLGKRQSPAKIQADMNEMRAGRDHTAKTAAAAGQNVAGLSSTQLSSAGPSWSLALVRVIVFSSALVA